ncbi:hypothetical protein [Gorillibacterium timonense]|uniref:hypothetical protein n=1 Tax=Gorillibacterium timonense TaxID=1689269 RepID=UPI0011DDCC4E|nr:hypothetical protein [Gorillibacterium timonense]
MKKAACLIVLVSAVLIVAACRNSNSGNEKNINQLTQEIERLKTENSRLTEEIEKGKESDEKVRPAAEKWASLDDRYRMLTYSYKALLKAVKYHPEILPARVDYDDPLKKPIFDAVQDITKLVPLKENQFAVLAYAHFEQETTAYIEVIYIETNGEGDEENEEIRTGSNLTIYLDKQNGKWVLKK